MVPKPQWLPTTSIVSCGPLPAFTHACQGTMPSVRLNTDVDGTGKGLSSPLDRVRGTSVPHSRANDRTRGAA